MRVLITGGTGLVGTKIRQLCAQQAIAVNYLTRNKNKLNKTAFSQGFYWNPEQKEMDVNALKEVSVIINLSGANLFHLWTKRYKKKIRASRIDSLRFLYRVLEENQNQVEHLVSASAIGIYPNSFQNIYNEDEANLSHVFLGKLVQEWEKEADKFRDIGLDVAKIRTGIVLANEGGFFPLLKFFVKHYLGTILGSGHQWQSWIHITDIAEVYLFAASNRLDGVYNAVAPNPVTQEELLNTIAKYTHRELWLPHVPEVILKIILGEMSQLPLSSQLVESKKLKKMGYHFRYANINKALENLLHKNNS